MDESQKRYADLKKPDTKNIYCIILFTWSLKPGKLTFVDKYQINSCLWGELILTRCRHVGLVLTRCSMGELSGVIQTFYILILGVVTEVYAPVTTDLTAYLNGSILLYVYKLYLNKIVVENKNNNM